MAGPLTANELQKLLDDVSTPDHLIAPYVQAEARPDRAMTPTISVNKTTVAGAVTRGVLGLDLAWLNERTNQARNARFERKLADGWTGPRLLAEGDSWFLYPILLRDVIDNLEADHAVHSVAAAGDTLDNMLDGAGALDPIIQRYDIDAVLLSGGGNDIAGDALLTYLTEATTARQPEAFIGAAYAQFLSHVRDRLNRLFQAHVAAFPNVHIFIHGYDHPLPQSGGPWLMKAMRMRGVPAEHRAAIARVLVDRYYAALHALAADFAGQVTVVDCRGCAPQADDWFDELHPRNAGYARAADRFRQAISARFAARPRSRSIAAGGYTITWSPAADHNGHRRTIERPFWSMVSIGRDGANDIVLDDLGVSRDHAQVEFTPTTALIRDLGSTNGTRLAGARISRGEWHPGQSLSIGQTSFDLARLAPSSSASADGVSHIEGTAAARVRRSISVEVCHGDIRQTGAGTHLLALFENVSPTASQSASLAIDRAVDGHVSALIQGKRFEAHLGAITTVPAPDDAALNGQILLAGLGATATFAPHAVERLGAAVGAAVARADIADIATVPIGSGLGLSAATSARRFLAGFADGFSRTATDAGAKRVRLIICDRDGDKAAGALAGALAHADDAVPSAAPVDVRVGPLRTLENDPQTAGTGAELAADDEPLNPLYVFVDALAVDVFAYSLLGHESGAAMPRYEKLIPIGAMDGVAAAFSDRDVVTARTGELVAQTFLPETVMGAIAAVTQTRKSPIVIVHDAAASRVPWEAIHLAGTCPLLEGGISRLHKSAPGRSVSTLRRGPDQMLRMLLIEDPQNNLAKAKLEGQMLADLFEQRFGTVTVLRGNDATFENVRTAIAESTFDIFHFAGHADFEDDVPSDSGVELNDRRLRASDLHDMASVPQLVFLNACESGRIRGGDGCDPTARGRSALARLSVAEGFLAMGTTNFIGTYWPVADDAAHAFAIALYACLLAGQPMGTAMLAARRAVADVSRDDWMNYMHFGDPTSTLRHKPEPSV